MIPMMIQNKPTLEDLLEYEELLIDAVEKHINIDNNPNSKDTLLILQGLLKSRAVKTFVDQLGEKKFSLKSFKKIQEIDDILDQLRIMNLNLPYPQEYFLLQQGKDKRARRNTLMAIFLGLMGYEWVG